ncbi:hypothetical protein [Streptosporangium jomthongense]|uniref:Uncharacterized protein n=2 Tax=Streptosporangium TaxID=2000 RepID=A0ABV8F2N4_9ACTN
MLDRQGKSGVHETVLAGDEESVARAVRRYADAGTTELLVNPLGDERERARTVELFASV